MEQLEGPFWARITWITWAGTILLALCLPQCTPFHPPSQGHRRIFNPIFKTGLICTKTLPHLQLNDSNYKERQVEPEDFITSVKGFSLTALSPRPSGEDPKEGKDGKGTDEGLASTNAQINIPFTRGLTYKFPTALTLTLRSIHPFDLVTVIALNEHVRPVGKYFSEFELVDSSCEPALSAVETRLQIKCEAKSSNFQDTFMQYLKKYKLDDAPIDVYWSPLSSPALTTYEYVQFYFIAINTETKEFYPHISTILLNVNPPEVIVPPGNEPSKSDGKIPGKPPEPVIMEPAHIDSFKGFEVKCESLEKSSYNSSEKDLHNVLTYMDPSLFFEVFGEPFQDERASSGDSLYDECTISFGCVGYPPDCVRRREGCDTLIRFHPEKSPRGSHAILVQIYTKQPGLQMFGYTAVGFSHDIFMGDDIVVECAITPSGRSNVFLSWNTDHSNKRISHIECHPNSWLLTGCSYLIDTSTGMFSCEFYMKDFFIYRGNRFDFISESYHIMGASGQMLNESNIGMHDQKFVTSKRVSLSSVHEPPLLVRHVKIHGIIMVVIWVVIIPNSIFLARYFKESWTKKLILERRIYFTLHVFLMLVGFVWLLISLGNILYVTFRKRKHWNEDPVVQSHMKVGGSACFLYLIQNCSGWVRPIDEGSRRIFSIAHWTMGTAIFFLGFTNLLKSPQIPAAAVPCFVPLLVLLWLLWTVVCHVIMAFHFRWVDTVLGRKSKRGFSPLPLENATHESAPGSWKRVCIWLLYCLGTILIAGGMSSAISISKVDCDCAKEICYV